MEDQKLIPAELVFEILSRIPCRPLLEKFRYVCKLWYAIIKDPQFIYLHLERSRKSSTQLAIVTGNLDRSSVYLSSLSNQVQGNWTRKQLLSKTGLNHFYPIALLSVNGLICIHNISNDIHVCNPSTGEFITLPKSNLCREGYAQTLGFGFDSLNKEYKVVRVCFDYWNGYESDVDEEIIEIFTLGSKAWRRIIHGHTGPLTPYTASVASVDGIIYWVVDMGLDQELEIVAFDVRTEELSKVPYPKSSRSTENVVLLESGGRLYLGETRVHYWFREEVEIWMLEDCSNWVKAYYIDLDGDLIGYEYHRQRMHVIPICISDQKILFETVDGEVACYDLERRSFTKIYEESRCGAVSYIESLAPLRPR